ncbi:succinylglutamate desuccinylase/aspartoacylase domain-containing protein [Marivirga harenae]|uniref:succinylglutamate desuccinylase/aspartoacylase domain-containing protein n=1 Tax=Marivirga harenae TaxID=2010992 RepID=UPI0026DEEEBD|nr:succinylglutamate desuccinylase/aspartoacylase family protein [Marivirga harenae]WKV11407.1 succinylglutamate desuccinylase/aspartoacylase family protein [Marivirga harenae]
MIFIGGIHGNEPAGVLALDRMMSFLQSKNIPLNGNLYALAGSLWALENGERYHKHDLNRLWTKDRLLQIQEGEIAIEDQDTIEQIELYECIKNIIAQDEGPFYFIDLHTTSCETSPFIVMNDSLLNRRFTSLYPLPSILGIEEYLEGPVLSYINELGYVAFGFEAGQHDDEASIDFHYAFCMLSLQFTGLIEKKAIDINDYYDKLLSSSVVKRDFFEILYRYEINPGEDFKMLPGFVNFEAIKKGQKLAISDNQSVLAETRSRIFMPLYQAKGSEGFFAIKKVSLFALKLSAVLRNIGLDRLLGYLPGVSYEKQSTLRVNRKIARFFTKDFFHLLGYRSKVLDQDHYLMSNREAASRTDEYELETWFK